MLSTWKQLFLTCAKSPHSKVRNQCFHVDTMKQLFQDIHIDSIMTFLKEMNLFNKNILVIFLNRVLLLYLVSAYIMLYIFNFLNLVQIF